MPHPDETWADDGILHAYLDGALSPDDRRRVDAVLAASAVVRARLATARAALQESDALLALVEPAALSDRPVNAQPPASATKGFDLLALRWAAGFLLIVGGMWLLTPGPDRSQLNELAPPPLADAPAEAASPSVGKPAPMPSATAPARDLERTAAPSSDAGTSRPDVGSNVAPPSAPSALQPAPVAPAPASPPSEPGLRLQGAERAESDERARRPAAAAVQPVPRRIDLETAAALLNGPVSRLPALAFQSAALLRDSPPLVRLTYRTADGTDVLLDQEPAGEDLASGRAGEAPSASGNVQQQVLQWSTGNRQLRLLAPLTRDSLAALRRAVQ